MKYKNYLSKITMENTAVPWDEMEAAEDKQVSSGSESQS